MANEALEELKFASLRHAACVRAGCQGGSVCSSLVGLREAAVAYVTDLLVTAHANTADMRLSRTERADFNAVARVVPLLRDVGQDLEHEALLGLAQLAGAPRC